MSEDELRQSLIDKLKHYSDHEALDHGLKTAIQHKDRDIRVITPIMLCEILLQEHQNTLPQKTTEDRIIEWEQSIIDESNESTGNPSRQIHNFDFFKFVLQAAWENNNEVSPDEKNLIERIRVKLKITEGEYRLVEAQLGRFPKTGNEVHTRDEINAVRIYLQETGLLLTFRDSDGCDHDVVPEEMEAGLREAFGLELKRHGFRQLVGHKSVKNRTYLESALAKSKVALSTSLKLNELQELCVEHVSPKVLLGGVSPRDGLELKQLSNWCRELGLQVAGSKDELINRIISHYDKLFETSGDSDDERAPWFAFFEEFAARNYTFLRSQGLIEKDQDVDKRFERATDYLFEIFLGHKPLHLPGLEQPDGALSLGDGVLLWDNKSKEKLCSLKTHLTQFGRYFAKAERKAAALIVIAPEFTEESDTEAKVYEIQSGDKLSLITAAELKDISVRWKSSAKADDAFPLKYLATAGRFNPSILNAIF